MSLPLQLDVSLERMSGLREKWGSLPPFGRQVIDFSVLEPVELWVIDGFVAFLLPCPTLHWRVPTIWGQAIRGGKASKHLLSWEHSVECSSRQDDQWLLSRSLKTCSFSDPVTFSPRIRTCPGPMERACSLLIPGQLLTRPSLCFNQKHVEKLGKEKKGKKKKQRKKSRLYFVVI